MSKPLANHVFMLAVLAMASVSLPAMAQNTIVLGPTSGLQSPCDLANAGGGTIQVNCFKSSSGSASFGSDTGTYSLGTMDNTFGPTNASGVLPADGTVVQSFQYGPDSAGNQTAGTITWGTLDYQGDLSGTYVPTVVIGTAAFTAVFQVGTSALAAETLGGGLTPGSLLMGGPGKSAASRVSSGDITGSGSGPMCKWIYVCTGS